MKLLSKASLVCLAVAMLRVVVATAAEETKAEALPSAKEVLERYAKAIGGKDVFAKHQSQHAIGTVEMNAQGIKGKLEVWAARPNKLLMKMTMAGVGEFKTGFDGKIGWMTSALTGPMLLEGKSGLEVATQADFDHALHDPSDYTKMAILGVEDFNGEACYKLKLVHRTGFESTEYFSKATGLQRGFTATQETPLGPITATSQVTDYKQFGDLLMQSRVSQKAAGVETVMTIEEMQFNKVDPAVFELPDDVKALASQPSDEEKAPSKPAAEKTEKTKKSEKQ